MPKGHKDLSRRDFVRNGTLAGASVAAFTVLKSKDARAEAPIKVGLIGCGGRGKFDATNCMAANKDVKVTAMADLFQDRIDTARTHFQERVDVTVSPDQCFVGWDAYKKVLETDVDMVILTTPPAFRPMTMTAAIAANKHVFIEKPAAVDAPGIREIMKAGEAAKAKGLSVVAGTQRRHQANRRQVLKRVHDGEIGDIVAARSYWIGGAIAFREKKPDWTDMEYQVRNWYHFLWLSGDHIVEQHVHNLDMVNWAMQGHPVKAFGFGGRSWQQRGNIWDHHSVDFEYENGVRLSSMCRQIGSDENMYINVSEFVVGTKGSSNLRNMVARDASGSKIAWEFPGELERGETQEFVHLVESIRNNEPVNYAQDVAESTMTAILGRTAEYSGQLVTWDDALKSDETLMPKKLDFGPVELRPVAVPGNLPYTGKEGWNPG